MAAIFREKQRKNTKNSRILAKKTTISSSNGVFLCHIMESYISETNLFSKISKNKMAAIFQCKSVNIKENAIKNELIDLKLSRKRGMVCFFGSLIKEGYFS